MRGGGGGGGGMENKQILFDDGLPLYSVHELAR